ncbi:MAG: O-methyltransferase [Pseudomonadota bacterium]|nr:O-methyltransferase [Pseudomonadota bacterium]
MAVFDKLDYSVRVNKSIERKLIFDKLDKVLDINSRDKYRYIGMGSIWFVDFKIAHKKLGINNMHSIEKNDIGYHRALFNRPYECITIQHGDVSSVLPTLELENNKNLVWLDYECPLTKDILEETREFCERTSAESVIIITINCSREAFRSDESSNISYKLKEIVDDLLPQDVKASDLDVKNFPKTMSDILVAHLKRAVRKSGRSERFHPLFNYLYKDGMPMLTVGGIITNKEQSSEIYSLLNLELSQHGNIEQTNINVPPLTHKEKAALDRLMPRDAVPTVNDIEELGFKLKQEQIESYYQYYKKYPIYLEAKI